MIVCMLCGVCVCLSVCVHVVWDVYLCVHVLVLLVCYVCVLCVYSC